VLVPAVVAEGAWRGHLAKVLAWAAVRGSTVSVSPDTARGSGI